ncbi:hypothetical protein [Pseudoduganella sp.]|uniref:hypothetical protein n=1 Tax=Pseudoduganella sp. TaxID=1880898 RepID=UPI0035B118CA
MIRAILSTAFAAVTTGAQAAPLPCQPQSQLDIATIKERVILVGELHGTNEMPAFVSGLACSLLRDGRQVALSLEVAADVQPEIERYLVSDGSEAARQPLYGSSFGRLDDGRGSAAIMEIIEQARVLRLAGAPITLVATDLRRSQAKVAPGEKWDPATRDRIMAENIGALARAKPDAVVLSLSGNAHATRREGAPYPSLAYLLAQQMPVHTVGLAHKGGSAWVCTGVMGGKLQCGAHAMSGLGGRMDARGYDREVKLGGITASPPVREGQSALGRQGGAQ